MVPEIPQRDGLKRLFTRLVRVGESCTIGFHEKSHQKFPFITKKWISFGVFTHIFICSASVKILTDSPNLWILLHGEDPLCLIQQNFPYS